MAFSHPKHFWTWFQRYANTLLQVHKMDKKEKEYWLRELYTHLRAYTKKLSYLIVWNEKGTSRFIISADGNARYFNMAEKMAAKAPKIPGWEILGLQPPQHAPQQMVEEKARETGLEFSKCWFLPPDYDAATGKAILRFFTEVYTDITDDMMNMMCTIVCNFLGEKVYTLEIKDIELESIFYLPEKEKERLIKLEHLPEHMQHSGNAVLKIDASGKLVNK